MSSAPASEPRPYAAVARVSVADPVPAPELPATVHAADGTPLALRHLPAGSGTQAAHGASARRGTVCIVHGLGEHSGRYGHVAQALNGRGWEVVAYDQRGHGVSGGPRGRLRCDDDLITDLAVVVDEIRRCLPGPLILLGQGMGGLVAAVFVAAQQRAVDGLVLSSPALDPGLGWLRRLIVTLGDLIAPNVAAPNGLPLKGLSRDAAVIQAYKADPLVHDRISPRLAQFIVDGGEFVMERVASWTVPTLLMWAGADRLVAPRGSARFVNRVPASLLTYKRFVDSYHELFHEPDQQVVIDMLLHWLEVTYPQARIADPETHHERT